MDWEKIIPHKPYSALTEQEKESIGPEMEAHEYDRLRAVWQETQRFFQTQQENIPEPRPEIRLRVRAHLRQQAVPGLGGKFRRWINYRIPAYQAVAAALVLLGLIHWGDSGIGNQGYGMGTTVIVDSTRQDSADRTGVNLYEDSVFSQFLIEAF